MQWPGAEAIRIQIKSSKPKCAVQLVKPNLCTKFYNPKSSSCWENVDEKCLNELYIGVTDGKNENWKNKAKWGLAS